MPRSHRLHTILAVLLLGASAIGCAWWLTHRGADEQSIIGMVRETEIRIAPEVSGRLAAYHVKAGQVVHKGDLLAKLTSPEMAAAVEEARARAAAARAARDRVYAGPRQEIVEAQARAVEIAEANLVLAQQEQVRAQSLAVSRAGSVQRLDEANATLRKSEADLALQRALYEEAKAGATKEELAKADTAVVAAEQGVRVAEARLAKTSVVAPGDAVVGILVAEPGEAILPGQAVMTLRATDEPWFSFTVREDRLRGLTVGSSVRLAADRGSEIEARVTEVRAFGEFATWRAARAVGDHDLNSFFVRADPVARREGLEPGMTVWLRAAKP